MSEYQSAQRFGRDAPARIRSTSNLYSGAEEMSLPGEPTYPTVLPFISHNGLSVVGGGMVPEIPEFRDEATQLDLYFNADNDVTIPLIFRDDVVSLDMSGAADWDWYAQIRTGRGPGYLLISDMVVTAEYQPVTLPDVPVAQTVVTMFLPRQNNIPGDYYWDLKSVSPATSVLPGEDPDETPGTAHTWLWGEVHIAPTVTAPPDDLVEVVVVPVTSNFLAVATGTGFTVGPNGVVG